MEEWKIREREVTRVTKKDQGPWKQGRKNERRGKQRRGEEKGG